MTFILLILLALVICFFIYSMKNRYALFLATMVISIMGIFYSVLSFIYKSGYYYYTSHALGFFDYSFFRSVTSLVNDYTAILRINNVSIALYMASVVLFTIFYFRHRFNIGRKSYLLLIFPVFYVWFYDPRTTYLMYIYTVDNVGSFLYYLVYSVDILSYALIFIYAFIPLFYVFRLLKQKESYINRKRSILVSVSLCIIDLFFTVILLVGLIRKPYFMVENILSVPKLDNTITSEVYLLVSIAGVFLVAFLLYMINKFSMTAKIGFFKQYIFKHNLNELNKNYINVFHSVKNIIYSYKLILERASTQEGEEKEATLRELETKIDNYVTRISFMLDIENNNLEIEPEQITLEQLIDETMLSFHGENISIEKSFDKSIFVNVDTFYMTDAILNIVQNSADAIKKTNHSGIIRFEGSRDGEWAVLKISDNGCGMTKKEIHNLFRPFYTTKSRITNWGIGLSFSYRTIRFHGGYISVESTQDVGTDIYIYLPLTQKTQKKIPGGKIN